MRMVIYPTLVLSEIEIFRKRNRGRLLYNVYFLIQPKNPISWTTFKFFFLDRLARLLSPYFDCNQIYNKNKYIYWFYFIEMSTQKY